MNNYWKTFAEIDSILPEIKIRKMINEDTNNYCVLFQSVFSQHPWNETWTDTKIRTAIHRLMCKKYFFGIVAESTSGTIGYLTGFRLGLLPSLFYLDQLFIQVDHQGKNVGKMLLCEATKHISGLGSTRIFLLTKQNSIAEKFYLNNDFKLFLPAIHIKGKSIFYRNI